MNPEKINLRKIWRKFRVPCFRRAVVTIAYEGTGGVPAFAIFAPKFVTRKNFFSHLGYCFWNKENWLFLGADCGRLQMFFFSIFNFQFVFRVFVFVQFLKTFAGIFKKIFLAPIFVVVCKVALVADVSVSIFFENKKNVAIGTLESNIFFFFHFKKIDFAWSTQN